MIKVTLRNGNQILVGTTRDADKLRGSKYTALDSYELLASDYSLLEYLHNEALIPATADAPHTAFSDGPANPHLLEADFVIERLEAVKTECMMRSSGSTFDSWPAAAKMVEAVIQELKDISGCET